MGEFRNKHQNMPGTQISGVDRKDFGVSEEALFQIFQTYYQARLNAGDSAVAASKKVMECGLSFDQICYLTAISMELIIGDYFRRELELLHGNKPLGLLN
jgi:hypothetical protein